MEDGTNWKRVLWGTVCREECEPNYETYWLVDRCRVKEGKEKIHDGDSSYYRWPRAATPIATMFSKEDTTCPEGTTHKGALCVVDKPGCPTGTESCGPLACSSDSTSCKKTILKMILKTAMGVGEMVVFATTLGAGNFAIKAGETIAEKIAEEAVHKAAWIAADRISDLVIELWPEKQLSKKGEAFLTSMKKKASKTLVGQGIKVNDTTLDITCSDALKKFVDEEKKRETTEDKIKKIKAFAAAFEPTGVFGIIDSCKDKEKSSADCARAVVSAAAQFDITGILSIASAYIYPICELPDRKKLKK